MKARVRRPGSSAVGDRLGHVAAHLAVGGLQPAQGHVERQLLLAVEVDADGRHLLAEQPAPGARAGDRLLGQDLLLGLGEQVRAVAAGAAQVVRGRSPAPASASSSRPGSSGSAAHSSSKNSSLVSISVARSWTSWSSAPRSGPAVSVAKRSEA